MILFSVSRHAAELAALNKSLSVIHFDVMGNILLANDNFLTMMGYRTDEIRGKHHRLFVPAAEAKTEGYHRFWLDLREGKFQRAQVRRVRKDGAEVWLEASYNPVLDRRGRVTKIIEYATDITESKRIEADHVGQIDAIGKSQAVIHFTLDGFVTYVNEAFLGVFGYTWDEVIGRHHKMFVEPGYATSADYLDFWARRRQGQFETAQFKRYGKGGKEIWLEASYNPIYDSEGRPFKVVKYATDISKQKLVEAESVSQIEAIARSQAVIHLGLDGTILFANANFLVAVGYRLEEIVGRHHSIFVSQSYAESEEYKAFWTRLNRGEFVSGEHRRLARDGRSVWLLASYNPIFDLNGRPFKVVKFATVISAQVEGRIRSRELTKEMYGSIQAVAAASEEMTSSIQEISKNMAHSSAAVGDIAEKIKLANGLMTGLRETSASMQAVVDLIRSIAGQVNLLALNATIEAARAGDAGRGFAVVAAEVKGLATQTSTFTDDIAQQIKALQEMCARAAESSTAIDGAASSVSQSISAIASAIEQQQAVTQEISASMQRSSQCVGELSDCIETIAAAA